MGYGMRVSSHNTGNGTKASLSGRFSPMNARLFVLFAVALASVDAHQIGSTVYSQLREVSMQAHNAALCVLARDAKVATASAARTARRHWSLWRRC